MGVRSRRKSNQKMESCVSTRAFIGNAGRQNIIERRDPVGGDDQQSVIDGIDVAHFAAGVQIARRSVPFPE